MHGADGNRLAEYEYDLFTGAPTLLREYIWLDGRAVAVIEGGQVYLIRTDHIYRPAFATNMSGTVVWEASYLPFGGVHTSPGSNSDLRFPGQWYQSESGLHQNWMRDYDPTTGRYIQADPLGLVDGASVYGYALQNPGKYIDPRGEAIWIPMVAGALVGGYLGYHQSGCWQGALLGALLGAAPGALAGKSIYGLMAAEGAAAGAGTLGGSFVSGMCGCDGDGEIDWNAVAGSTVAGALMGPLGGELSGSMGNQLSDLYPGTPNWLNELSWELLGESVGEFWVTVAGNGGEI